MREHGTRAKYVLEKCRCAPCTIANREYARARDRRTRRPDEEFVPAYIDAREVRNHLRWLARKGVGYNRVAAVARVSHNTVHEIRSGRQQRCTPAIAEKVLLVFPVDAADRAHIDAAPTWRLLDDLLAHGYTRASIARALGSRSQTPALQVGRERVTGATARKVKELHARLLTPVVLDRQRNASQRAKYRAPVEAVS